MFNDRCKNGSNFWGRKETHVAKQTSRWEAPPTEFIKMNVDASFDEDTRSDGWGTIGRDNSLDICVAADEPLRMMSDAMHAEVTALSNAMQVAEHIGKVIFKMDEECHVVFRLFLLNNWHLA
jgi:hypothetical protein